MASMPRPEVLVATIAVFLTAEATRAKSWRLISRSSITASKTQSASFSCAQSSSKLPGPDAGRVLGQVQRRGLELLELLDSLPGQRAERSPSPAHHVQQGHLEALRHQVGGHLRPHRSAAQDDRFLDVTLH